MRKDTFPANPTRERIFAEEAAAVDASELIAQALERSGMNRSELADALGVNRSEITVRLRGERNMSVRTLAATLWACGARLELKSHRVERGRATVTNFITHTPRHERSLHDDYDWRTVKTGYRPGGKSA